MIERAQARSDEIALEKLADDPDVPDDLIGFHAQQALEKLLKSALAYAGVAPPRIHDLGELMARLADVGLSPSTSVGEVRALVPWTVRSDFDTGSSPLTCLAIRRGLEQLIEGSCRRPRNENV